MNISFRPTSPHFGNYFGDLKAQQDENAKQARLNGLTHSQLCEALTARNGQITETGSLPEYSLEQIIEALKVKIAAIAKDPDANILFRQLTTDLAKAGDVADQLAATFEAAKVEFQTNPPRAFGVGT